MAFSLCLLALGPDIYKCTLRKCRCTYYLADIGIENYSGPLALYCYSKILNLFYIYGHVSHSKLNIVSFCFLSANK